MGEYMMRQVVITARVGAGLALTACLSMRAGSSRTNCPPATGAPFLTCQVDRDASAAEDPSYPSMLRSADVSGRVRAAYIVDSTGRVASFKVLGSDHGLFSASVRNAIGSSRFTPAEKAGRPVAIQRVAVFEFISDSLGGVLPIKALHDTLPDGTPRTIIESQRRDPAVTRSLTTSERIEVQRLVLENLVSLLPVDSPGVQGPTICVMMLDTTASRSADDETLARLSGRTHRVVNLASCPKTYASMFARSGEPPPPAGWIDPYYLRITSVQPWTRDVTVLDAVESQGTGDIGKRCVVVRAVSPWNIKCRSTWSRVH
jgi:hypothetical protein